MVSGGSVDGLISGMSTSDIISQLIQVEAAPQTKLKAQVSTASKAVSAYQSLNTRMSAVLGVAKDLTSATTWSALRAGSSSTSVAATVTSSTTASTATGSLTFDVNRLSAAHAVVSVGKATALTDPVVSGSPLRILRDGQDPVTINAPADSSLLSVVTAINATANAGVRAAAVQVEPGRYRLQVTSTSTGNQSAFTLDGLDGLGGYQVATQGADAKITVGTGPGAYEVLSATNTFTGVLPGVTFTATRQETGVTLTLAPDSAGVSGKVRSLVDTANAALDEIRRQGAYKTDTTAAGPLAGDFAVRQLSDQILSAVSSGAGGLGSLKQVGIELTRDGHLTYNEQTFLDLHKTSPATAKAYFDTAETGLATRLRTLADKVGRSGDGTLTMAIEGRNTQIQGLNDRVAEWDVRLSLRKQSLQRQFASMETALGKMKDQSNWLAGQISSLPTAK
jgi:flagellar hook-associated protein 2